AMHRTSSRGCRARPAAPARTASLDASREGLRPLPPANRRHRSGRLTASTPPAIFVRSRWTPEAITPGHGCLHGTPAVPPPVVAWMPVGEGDRAAGLALTIQIVVNHSSGIASPRDR